MRIQSTASMTAAKKHEYYGRMLTVAEAAEETGIPKNTLWGRMKKKKMTLEQAVEFGPVKHKELHLYHGEMLTLKEIAARAGRNCDLVGIRVRAGWSAEDAADTPSGKAGETIHRRYAEDETAAEAAMDGMSARERECYSSALAVCRHVVHCNAHEFNFRCIEPMKEYAFEGDILGYRILIRGGLARLSAWYRREGVSSDLCRIYRIWDGNARELSEKEGMRAWVS